VQTLNVHLSDLREGTTAKVRSIVGPKWFRERIFELGLLPGITVTVVKKDSSWRSHNCGVPNSKACHFHVRRLIGFMSMSCHDASGDNTLNVDAKVSSGYKKDCTCWQPQLWKIHAVQFDH